MPQIVFVLCNLLNSLKNRVTVKLSLGYSVHRAYGLVLFLCSC